MHRTQRKLKKHVQSRLFEFSPNFHFYSLRSPTMIKYFYNELEENDAKYQIQFFNGVNSKDANFFCIIQKENQIIENYNSVQMLVNKSNTPNSIQSYCLKHKKYEHILVLNKAEYICEDCAIYDHLYRHQQFLQKSSILQHLARINQKSQFLQQKQKSNKILTNTNLKSLLELTEQIQDQLINSINKQFLEIKTKLSNLFLINAEIKQEERIKNGIKEWKNVKQENNIEKKLLKDKLFSNDIKRYDLFLTKEKNKISNVYETLRDKLNHNVDFTSLLSSIKEHFIQSVEMSDNKQKKNQKQSNQPAIIANQDELLLDFSEFDIQNSKLQNQISRIPVRNNTDVNQQKCDQSVNLLKKNRVQRLKTAVCLQDSICSIQSLAKENENELHAFFKLKMENFSDNQPSLISDRSISAASEISRQSTCKQIFYDEPMTFREPHKKTSLSLIPTLQIKSREQIQTKLQSISPMIKAIKFSNLAISMQQMSTIIRQKISRSFIHTLEMSACSKINQKILFELKANKCKTLKKVQLRDCKDINWNDKKVKEMAKKLQADGLKASVQQKANRNPAAQKLL